MLRLKRSIDEGEESPSLSSPLTVTILSTQELSHYSTERYYMLSEIEEHGDSTQFLCDFDDDSATQETEELSVDSFGAHKETHPPFRLPAFAMLYFLWRPEMMTDAQHFAESVILPTVQKLQEHVQINNSADELKHSSGIFAPLPKLTIETDLDKLRREKGLKPTPEVSDNDDLEKTIRLYVVVDRLQHSDDVDDMSDFFQRQAALAEQLTRQIASNEILRTSCEGVTVGISNNTRSAPGLEACMNAIMFGAKNRRQHATGSKSMVGILAAEPGDLLGVEPEDEPEAAQGVWQRRICAEWAGQGNLQSFSKRAHRAWGVRNRLPLWAIAEGPEIRKRVSRRRPTTFKAPDPHAIAGAEKGVINQQTDEFLLNVVAVFAILGYLLFHLGSDMRLYD